MGREAAGLGVVQLPALLNGRDKNSGDRVTVDNPAKRAEAQGIPGLNRKTWGTLNRGQELRPEPPASNGNGEIH